MRNGIFGDFFDLNNDGNIDFFESGLGFMLLEELMKENEEDKEDDWC